MPEKDIEKRTRRRKHPSPRLCGRRGNSHLHSPRERGNGWFLLLAVFSTSASGISGILYLVFGQTNERGTDQLEINLHALSQ
jgi:hypothetical protein